MSIFRPTGQASNLQTEIARFAVGGSGLQNLLLATEPSATMLCWDRQTLVCNRGADI
jgi:hypothetical protein